MRLARICRINARGKERTRARAVAAFFGGELGPPMLSAERFPFWVGLKLMGAGGGGRGGGEGAPISPKEGLFRLPPPPLPPPAPMIKITFFAQERRVSLGVMF